MDKVLKFYFTLRDYKVFSVIKLTIKSYANTASYNKKKRIKIYVMDVSRCTNCIAL